MFSNKRKLIIIGVLVALILVMWLVIWFLSRSTATPAVDLPDDNNLVISDTTVQRLAELPAPSNTTVIAEKSYPLGLKQLAFSFAERYGTYSSDSNYKGLLELKALTTTKLQKYMDSVIAAGNFNSLEYQAYETRALSANLSNVGTDKAEVTVKTQRAYYVGNNEPQIFYQDILLNFIKVDGAWKVDAVYWL